jgi:hypothetical protein
MNLFDTIRSKIFGAHTAEAGTAAAAPAQVAAAAPMTPTSTPGASTAGAPTAGAAAAGPSVDVAAILDGLSKKSHERLDWRHSIVDLMKLLDMDSSLSARRDLALELNYDGEVSDSGRMNVWLHKQVMAKLAANGGKVPPELVH